MLLNTILDTLGDHDLPGGTGTPGAGGDLHGKDRRRGDCPYIVGEKAHVLGLPGDHRLSVCPVLPHSSGHPV